MSPEDAALTEAAIRADVDRLVQSTSRMYRPSGGLTAMEHGVYVPLDEWSRFVLRWGTTAVVFTPLAQASD